MNRLKIVAVLCGWGKLHRARAPLLAVLVALVLQATGALVPLDNWLGDLRFRFGERPASGEVVVVDIDARSLQEVGTWPWPRSIHGDLVDRLTALGAAEIAFDVDFSTTSNPVDDAAFAKALARAGGTTVLAGFAQASTGLADDASLTYNVPIEAFLDNAWLSAVNVRPDADGRVRRLPFGGDIDGMPTLSLAVTLAGIAAPPRGEFPVDFSIRPETLDHISVIDVLRGNVDGHRIAGKKVVVGANAVELHDYFQAPVYGHLSGADLQALGAETLIQGRLLGDAGLALEIAGLLATILVAMLAYRRLRWTAFLAGLVLAALAIEAGAILAQLYGATVVQTALWQVTLAGFAVFAIGSEIDFRRILLMISRTETRNARALLDQVISDNFAGVIVVGEDGEVRAASRSAARLLGIDPNRELKGGRIEDVAPPGLVAAARAVLEAPDAPMPSAPKELYCTRADGVRRRLDYVVTPSRLSGGLSTDGRPLPDTVVATLTFIDVTERRQAEERVAYLARFDTLTGLPNRNRFEEELRKALERYRDTGEPCAVLFFDLDRFKGINDTLGHDYGDRLLTAVARRLSDVVRTRSPADIMARFGGDEYAILLAGPVNVSQASALAGRLISVVGEPYDLDGHRLIVGLSVGIALPQRRDATVGTMMKNADAALYRAKAAGGGVCRIFDASIETAIRARRELEVELWDAFDRDEFEVFYQPQVDIKTRRLVGVEALLRWRHPGRGHVSPAEFIPVAEAVGLIEPLGRWTLEHACMEVAEWPVPLKLAVNVSPVQFVRGDLAAAVERVLQRSGLPSGRLNLEITESLFLQENKTIGETIDKLRALGVSFAIDDFGTGYSSLSYVRKFPVDKIKIDQSFVSGLPDDMESGAIVHAVCTLAKGLGIHINAEGVETEAQLTALRLYGCEEGQGYLFGRPQPAAGILQMIEAERRAEAPLRESA